LRHALGEFDAPPAPDTGEVEQYVGFRSETAARAFVEAASSDGTSVSTPVPVDGRSYDDETVRWQVTVRSTALPLSAGFELERGRLLTLAAEHGGSDDGWAGPPPDLRG
jgi:hypothetical protein